MSIINQAQTAPNANDRCEVPEGYKWTEVGVIPEDWGTLPLAELCPPQGIVRGPFGGALKKENFVESGFLVYEQRNAIYKTSSISRYYISQSKFNEMLRFKVSPKDFIISCSGTIGRIFQIPPEAPAGIINQALLKIRVDENVINDRFFYLVFEWDKFQARIVDSTQGGAMQNLVGMVEFKKTSFVVPPLPEQRAIAAALSDVDALIEALEQLIAKKRDIKQATMQQLLTGKMRLPGFGGEWEVKRLGDISTIAIGRTPSRTNNAMWGSGHTWLSISDLQGKVVSTSREQITDLAASQMTPIPKGTLLMSFKLSIGKLCFAGCDLFTNEAICSFTDLKANADYLYYALGRTDFSLYGKQGLLPLTC